MYEQGEIPREYPQDPLARTVFARMVTFAPSRDYCRPRPSPSPTRPPPSFCGDAMVPTCRWSQRAQKSDCASVTDFREMLTIRI